MEALLLGMSVGFFQYAYVNNKYNKIQWIDSKYLLLMGSLMLILCVTLFLI